MFFKSFFLFFAFIFFSFSILSANEKNQIITQLNNLDSLEFTFNQIINEKTEKGSCLLLFPGKLKCEYFDKKQKELVINNKKLAITQKRYNKTYYYPISKSPFLNILYKDKLLEIVKSGELKLTKATTSGDFALDKAQKWFEDNTDQDFLVFNPDTLWNHKYVNEINKMQNFYFSNKLNCILLVADKKLSFDKSFNGDFKLKDNLLQKDEDNNFIYIGCKIFNKSLFENYNLKNFSILEVWKELRNKNQLNGYESLNKFYHLTNLETFKKLKDL